ncbi:MAG: hypothetical protein AB7R89_13915 [Dehalococcoidia bacterium]
MRRMTRRTVLGAAFGVLAALLTLGPAGAMALVQVAPDATTLQLWTAALAIITTIVSSLLLSIPEHWGPWAKRGVVAVIAVVLSGAGLWYEGRFDTGDLGRLWLLVFLGATALYTLLWRPVSDALKGNPQT